MPTPLTLTPFFPVKYKDHVSIPFHSWESFFFPCNEKRECELEKGRDILKKRRRRKYKFNRPSGTFPKSLLHQEKENKRRQPPEKFHMRLFLIFPSS